MFCACLGEAMMHIFRLQFSSKPKCLVACCAVHCTHSQCSPQGSTRPQQGSTRPQQGPTRCTLHCASPDCSFHGCPNGRGREPDERRTRDPQRRPHARRLWYGDGSLHDGFRVLTHILSVWSISVLCIQEVQAGNFPSLPVDQPFHYDGPEGTFGRKAAFLVRDGVFSVPVTGVDDTTSFFSAKSPS